MSRLIYFESFPHTGSWFLINFIMSHPEVGGFLPAYQLPLALMGVDNPRKVLGGPNDKPPITEHMGTEHSVTLVHSHCQGADSCAWTFLNLHHGVLVSLRDPLMILVSWKQSVPNFNQGQVARYWRRYCAWYPHLGNLCDVIYFPIDWLAGESVDTRSWYLIQVLDCFDLETHTNIIHETASSWERVGGTGEGYRAEAQKAYDDRDVEFFERTIPEGFKVLRESEDLMRPFLEQWYKDLLWWS